MSLRRKFNFSPSDGQIINNWLHDNADALEKYKKAGYSASSDGLTPNGLTKLQGKKSRLYIGDYHVTEKSSPEAVIHALFSLPSPFGAPTATHKKSPPHKKPPHKKNVVRADNRLTHFKFTTDPLAGDNKTLKKGKLTFNQAEKLAQQGFIDKAINHYLQAADFFLQQQEISLAHYVFDRLADQLTQKMNHILTHNADYIQTVKKNNISKSWELKAINKKAAAQYNEILIYALDSAYRLEIQIIDKEAITIDEGLGGFITNTQKAATENLRDCHFLAIKNEPHDPTTTAISYVIHNDICSSASSNQPFAFMPKGKNRVILAGANSILSPTSITNVLDAVYAMASSEEDVIIEQSHLLCRNNITATACIYYPEKFTLYLGKGGLTHPDQIISSGFNLSEYKSNSYHTVAFDGRYHQPAHSDFIPANQNPRGEYDVTRHQPEQRFALGLTTAAAANIMFSDNDSRLYDCLANPNVYRRAGHWYNERDALKKAITHGRQQLANYLFNDGELLENLQQLYHLDDPMLAQTMILKNIHNFPVYVGAAAEKSNQHLGHYIKEILLDDRDFSIVDNEFLTQLQYYIVQSPDLPPPPKPQHPQISLQEKLAQQAVPLLVHYSNFEAVFWYHKDYQSLLPTYLGELDDYYRQSRNQLIEKIIEHGDAHHILHKSSTEPLNASEKKYIKDSCNEIPVFIGPNADLANQQLLEVITEYMQHPHYKELFTEFDKEKASLLHEIKQDIIAKLPQPNPTQAAQPTRNKKSACQLLKFKVF